VICKAEVQVLRADLKWKLVTRLLGTCLAVGITIGIVSCEQSAQAPSELAAGTNSSALTTTDGPLSEVNIPASIDRLAPSLTKFQPQVRIVSPKPDQTLTDDQVTVKLAVTDLPLFKQPELGLGNHLHVILDKQTYQGVYDLSQPLIFKNLAAGTHSLRVFASRPWHESFKNAGAYAQVSFNVLTKTAENNPDPNQPLLTYSRPTGTYGAEPIMLDYYLTNAPSAVTQGDRNSVPAWRIRATVNEQRFILDRWAPVYLQGFKTGKNLVRLELVDDRGNPIPNVYNDSVSIVTYDPQTKDTLAKLIRGEIDPNLARSLVDPNYVAIEPVPIPTPAIAPIPAPIPIPAPVNPPTPIPAPIPVPITLPSPVVIAPAPIVKPSPVPVVIAPAPVEKPVPTPIVQTPAVVAPETVEVPKPIIKPVAPPAPIPTPITSTPAPVKEIQPPIPVAKAPSVEIPTPEVVKTTPIVPTPQPTPTSTPKPAPIVVPVPTVVPEAIVKKDPSLAEPLGTRIDPPEPTPLVQPRPPQNEQRKEPTTIVGGAAPTENQIKSPQTAEPETSLVTPTTTNTWQTQANDLRKAAGVKIRAFTNTIPAKAQRFGHNVQIWVGNAINQIQAWRAAHVD
jgi:hypothetical protein